MTALAPVEAATLAEHEASVERGLSTFLDVGRALLAIRDERLYRAEHDTFESYCQDRWAMTDRYARNLMAAASVGTVVPVTNEAQARELAPLLDQPERLRDTWQQAQEQTAGKPTAAAIRSIVRPQPAQSPEAARITHTTTERTVEDFVADRVTGEVLSVEDWQQQPGPTSADLTSEVHDSLADSDITYAANLLRGITGTDRGLLSLDPRRTASALSDDQRDSALAFLDRLLAWSTDVRNALRPNHLRSIR